MVYPRFSTTTRKQSVGLQGILGPGSAPYMVSFHDDDSKARYQGDHNLYTYGKAALFRATDVRYMNDWVCPIFGVSGGFPIARRVSVLRLRAYDRRT